MYCCVHVFVFAPRAKARQGGDSIQTLVRAKGCVLVCPAWVPLPDAVGDPPPRSLSKPRRWNCCQDTPYPHRGTPSGNVCPEGRMSGGLPETAPW